MADYVSDRRRTPRVHVQAIVRLRDLESSADAFWSVTDDVGAGGLRLISATQLPTGHHLALEVVNLDPSRPPVYALGRVTWSDRRPAGSYAIGVQFLVDKSGESLLSRWTEELRAKADATDAGEESDIRCEPEVAGVE